MNAQGTFATAPGDATARSWLPDAIIEVRPVVLVPQCELPHICPECGCSWETHSDGPT